MTAARLLLVVILMLALLAALPAADAQQPTKVSRIGMLNTLAAEHPEGRVHVDVFRQALGELGYVEGRNIIIEYRWAEGRIERFPVLAAELVRLKVDLIVAGATPQARAAKQATTTIPIVAYAMQDPVKDGLVASLARPGGNVTGLTFLGPELVTKRLALLKEAVPGVSRVAALWHPGGYAERTRKDMVKDAEVAARGLGVKLQFVGTDVPNNLDGAFSAMTRERADALIVFPSALLYGERKRIVDLAPNIGCRRRTTHGSLPTSAVSWPTGRTFPTWPGVVPPMWTRS
jgi:putative tryptophan/tyrosine transport system substrate-binding protein